MVLISTALHCEARPIIENFNLKKDNTSTRFYIYTNQDLKLIVTGTGIMKSAIAATYLLALPPGFKDALVFNTGICGSALKTFETGRPILFNKIVNTLTNRSFYPDILLNHDFYEGTLYSFTSQVIGSDIDKSKVGFVDMEAAGFMEAASVFVPPHRIFCLKFVSDHLEGKKLDPHFVGELIKRNLPHIEKMIASAHNLLDSNSSVLSQRDLDLLDSIGENLRLSATMKQQLKNLAIRHTVESKNSLELLEPFLKISTKSKQEGKKLFEELKRLLIDR